MLLLLLDLLLDWFSIGSNVTYVISAEDNAGNTISTEEMGYNYQYQVIPEYSQIKLGFLALGIILLVIKLAYKKKEKKIGARAFI